MIGHYLTRRIILEKPADRQLGLFATTKVFYWPAPPRSACQGSGQRRAGLLVLGRRRMSAAGGKTSRARSLASDRYPLLALAVLRNSLFSGEWQESQKAV